MRLTKRYDNGIVMRENVWLRDVLQKLAAYEDTGLGPEEVKELTAKVNSLQIFADNISKLPNCNTCLKQNRCEFMPRWGEYCRINCPAWLGAPEPPKEKT